MAVLNINAHYAHNFFGCVCVCVSVCVSVCTWSTKTGRIITLIQTPSGTPVVSTSVKR